MFGRKKKAKKLESITVKVFRAGSKGVEVALNGHRTIDDAIKAAGFQIKETEVVHVNGRVIDNDEIESKELNDGDKVVLVKNIQGGNK